METICINENFSTTRLLFKDNINLIPSHYSTDCKQNGGLTKNGYYKKSMINKPLISIITVVLNAEQYIENTIQSVINQSYDNIEYIIIDGGSTDKTLSIIKKYDKYIDFWISEPDNGIYDAMNKGVSFARGEWIYFINADDILYNNIERIIPHLTKRNGVYYGDVILKHANMIKGGCFSSIKLMFQNINHQAIFYPRRVFEKYKYLTKFITWADYYLNIKCFCDKEFVFKYMPVKIALFNELDGYSKKNNDDLFVTERAEIYKINFGYFLYFIYLIRKKIISVIDLLKLRKFVVNKIEILGLDKFFIYK
jgi:glycosyltransferase involved in cell wall biosynthesis